MQCCMIVSKTLIDISKLTQNQIEEIDIILKQIIKRVSVS